MPAITTPPRGAAPNRPETGPIRLPLAFILLGVVCLFAGVAAFVAQPSLLSSYHCNQGVIAVTHLFVLGWICSVVMGAMYQLVPVALETRLPNPQLAWWHLVLHAVGFSGMLCMFAAWQLKPLAGFGLVFALGGLLFACNIARSLVRAPKWNVTALAVAAALCWLGFAMLAGLSIATAKWVHALELDGAAQPPGAGLAALARFMGRFDAISAMHAHAHLGAVGCFTMLIVGVSYKLVPMFTLSDIQNRWRATFSVLLLNVSLLGAFVTILLQSRWKLLFSAAAIIALGLYVGELRAILNARRRAPLDWGLKYFLTAVGILVTTAGLGFALCCFSAPVSVSSGQLENLYGFLALIGGISLALIGMLYKIVPFLVWFSRYSTQIGRQKVPALADMYSARWQAAGYWLFLFGLTLTSAGIVLASDTTVRAGCLLLAGSLLSFAVNLGFILSHLIRPRLQPLQTFATLKPA